jgi:hypothetical protein
MLRNNAYGDFLLLEWIHWLSLESWTQVGSRKLEVGIKPGKPTAYPLKTQW